MFFQNVGIYLQVHVVSQPRTPSTSNILSVFKSGRERQKSEVIENKEIKVQISNINMQDIQIMIKF
jgi:hypothetical protein